MYPLVMPYHSLMYPTSYVHPTLCPSLSSQYPQLVSQLPPASNRLGCLIFNDVLPVTLHVDWAWVKRATPFFLAQPGALQALVKILGVTTR